jgi:hypothetical protein
MTVAEIAKRIAERRKIYEAAYQGDLDRLAHEFGEHPVREALRMIEQRRERDQRAADTWDARQHAREVRRGIHRVINERRRRARELFSDGELLPGSWR